MRLRKLRPACPSDWTRELEMVGADPGTWSRLSRRSSVLTFRLGPLRPPAASILKQCMLTGGADAIVARGTITCTDEETDALVVGTPRQILAGCRSLRGQPFGLTEVADLIGSALSDPPVPPAEIRCGRQVLDFSRGPLVMGILNVTPDSFSDGGLHMDPADAVRRGMEMSRQGAAIVDVGAESTRPGSSPVPPEEQLSRLGPVVEGLVTAGLRSVISVDTSSAMVAGEMLASGAGMVNDITALSDPDMADTVSAAGAALVLMHMKGTPGDMQRSPHYNDVLEEVYSFLERRVSAAETAGVARAGILVDPGIGFGKKLEDNVLLVRRLGEFRWLGCRVVLGHSRKSFLGELSGTADPAHRDASTHAVTAIAAGEADVVRVHDVQGAVQALRTAGGVLG